MATTSREAARFELPGEQWSGTNLLKTLFALRTYRAQMAGADFSEKRRHPRKPVNLAARRKSEAGFCEVRILDVSDRGFMACCSNPPSRGSYVEVRLKSSVLIGRVAWAADGRFGALTRNPVALDGSASKLENSRLKPGMRMSCKLRPDLQMQAVRSERLSRVLNFIAVIAAAAVFAGFVGSMAYQATGDPFEQVRSAFLKSAGPS